MSLCVGGFFPGARTSDDRQYFEGYYCPSGEHKAAFDTELECNTSMRYVSDGRVKINPSAVGIFIFSIYSL